MKTSLVEGFTQFLPICAFFSLRELPWFFLKDKLSVISFHHQNDQNDISEEICDALSNCDEGWRDWSVSVGWDGFCYMIISNHVKYMNIS